MSPVLARVAQVLQDYLPAELNLIDAEEGGDATPDVPASSYYLYDRRSISSFPAIALRPRPSRILQVLPLLMGQRVVAEHRVDVLFHDQLLDAGEDALALQMRVIRYAVGGFRVLCVMKEGLQTAADPTRWADLVLSAGDIDWGPQDDQGQGEIARTAVLPIAVRRTEVRS